MAIAVNDPTLLKQPSHHAKSKTRKHIRDLSLIQGSTTLYCVTSKSDSQFFSFESKTAWGCSRRKWLHSSQPYMAAAARHHRSEVAKWTGSHDVPCINFQAQPRLMVYGANICHPKAVSCATKLKVYELVLTHYTNLFRIQNIDKSLLRYGYFAHAPYSPSWTNTTLFRVWINFLLES